MNSSTYPLVLSKTVRSASLKEVCVSMVNSVTNASRVRVVHKSTVLDIALFTLFNSLILSRVQAGDWSSWKFVFPSVNLDNHWCNSMWNYQRKFHKYQKKRTFVRSRLRYDEDPYFLVQQISDKYLQSSHWFLLLRASKSYPSRYEVDPSWSRYWFNRQRNQFVGA